MYFQFFLIFLIIVLAKLSCFCQGFKGEVVETMGYIDPRPKFFQIEYMSLPGMGQMPANSPLSVDQVRPVEANNYIKANLRFPIILNDKFRLIGGLRYRTESLDFVEDALEERGVDFANVKQAGGELMFQLNLKNDRFLMGYADYTLNADHLGEGSLGDQLKTGAIVLLGKQKNPYTKIGYGAGVGYSLGRLRVSPIFMYEKVFNNRWSMAMRLPKSIQVQYCKSGKMYFYGAIEGNGASYRVTHPLIEGHETLEYRRSSVDLKVGVEREISDWLWFGISTGLSQPLQSRFLEPGNRGRDALVSFQQNIQPFLNFSIFAVPPKKLIYR